MVMWVRACHPSPAARIFPGRNKNCCATGPCLPSHLGMQTLGPCLFLYKSEFLLKRALKTAASTIPLADSIADTMYWYIDKRPISSWSAFTGGMLASSIQSPFKPAEIPPPNCMGTQTQGSHLFLGSTLSPKCHPSPLLYNTHNNRKSLHQKTKTRHRSKSHRLVTSNPASKYSLQSCCLGSDARNNFHRPCVRTQKRYFHVFSCWKPKPAISTANSETQLA